MSMWVRPCDLASVRHVQLSVRMSAVVSVSMNQSSSFEGSCPSTVGISWTWLQWGLIPSVLHARCLCRCAWFYALNSSWAWGWLQQHGNELQFICELQQFFCGCGFGSGRFKHENWPLSCQNCSNSSARGWEVSKAFNRAHVNQNKNKQGTNKNKTNENRKKPFIAVPYMQGVYCKNIWRKHGVEMYFRGGNTVRDLLVHPKDRDTILQMLR